MATSLVPTFRSPRAVAATPFRGLRKAAGTGKLLRLLRLWLERREVLNVKHDPGELPDQPLGVVAPWDAARDGGEAQFEVRAFMCGGGEDPVTGSLNASLAQWLIGAGLAPARYVAAQGTVLGRVGRVHIAQDGETIWVGGEATTRVAGTVTL